MAMLHEKHSRINFLFGIVEKGVLTVLMHLNSGRGTSSIEGKLFLYI